MINPLIEAYGLPKFDQVRSDHVLPAVRKVLEENRKQIAKRINSNVSPNWENVAEFAADLDENIEQIWSPIRHLNAVANDKALRQAYIDSLPLIAGYHIEIGQNRELYELWLGLENKAESLGLNSIQRKLIKDTLIEFRLSGINLNEIDRSKFLKLQQRLSILESKFEENVLDATDGWSLLINNQNKLVGMTEADLSRAHQVAKLNHEEGYRLTLDYPSYDAVMSYCENREIRKQIYTAYSTRASDKGPQAGVWDNTEIINEILEIRAELANLLGYKSYADLSLITKMAESPEKVLEFLYDLVEKASYVADKEFDEVKRFGSNRFNIKKLESWDLSYVSRKLKENNFQYNEEILKEYFPVEHVISGLFDLAKELFDLNIYEHQGKVAVWHEDVKLYDMTDEKGNLKAQFYLDLYARRNKRGGAWMDEFRGYRKKGNRIIHPVAYITCNSSPPIGDKPALFTHEDVVTLFHEFGHGLHHMLTRVPYAQLAGIKGVEWDAVELPSQFMENWCWNDLVIERISKHYKSGKPFPKSLRKILIKTRNFQSAMKLLRQIEFSLLDMKINMKNNALNNIEIQNLVDEIRDKIAVMKPPTFNRFQNSFSHIFGGGYAAGYYSYIWSEVLSADAFSRFYEEGIFNKKTGKSFMENILEKGGSDKAINLFERFRGREPRIDALIQILGINNQ